MILLHMTEGWIFPVLKRKQMKSEEFLNEFLLAISIKLQVKFWETVGFISIKHVFDYDHTVSFWKRFHLFSNPLRTENNIKR